MSCLPFHPGRMFPLGLGQAKREYQHRYSSRVRRMYFTGAALLLAAATHAALIARLIASVGDRDVTFPTAAPYAAAFIGVMPITYFLARLYMHSRADARQARAWLAELGALESTRRSSTAH